jgi:hypothetical protein
MHSLTIAARAGLPLLNGVQPSVDSLQKTVLPYLNTIDPATQHTTAEMIGPTTEALGPDIAGQEDQNGHFIRFPATVGSSPFYLPCQIYAGNPSSSQLIACSSLQTILSSFLNYNPVSSILGEAASTTGTLPLARGAGDGSAGGGSLRGGAARGVAAVVGAVRAGLAFGGSTR